MSIQYLRVKIKSLAAEATIIHKDEIKRKKFNRKVYLKTGSNPSRSDSVFWGLRSHRTWDVRRESRASQLAYGFLRGRSYCSIERPVRNQLTEFLIGRICQLAVKYGERNKEAVYAEVEAWLKAPPVVAEVAEAA